MKWADTNSRSQNAVPKSENYFILKTAPDYYGNSGDALTTKLMHTSARNNFYFLLQLVPDERVLITRWQIGWSTFVRVVLSPFQRGRPERFGGDVILGSTFTYQLGMTVALVRASWRGHVPEKYFSSTSQRDVRPALHLFCRSVLHWSRTPSVKSMPVACCVNKWWGNSLQMHPSDACH